MQTDLLYQTDAYLKEFTSEVILIDEENNAIVLDKTAFYPGGGGQPHDTGSISFDGKHAEVVKLFRNDGNIWITLNGSMPVVATEISGEINFDRRYQLMRTHTAMHILCGVIFRDYGARVTGGNMEPLKGRMDFEFEKMSRELVTEIEKNINVEVEQDREIKVEIIPRDVANKIPDLIRTKINLLPPGLKEIRTVEIVGLDLQADGGTHVNKTGEVGKIKISDYQSKGKINKRLKIELSV